VWPQEELKLLLLALHARTLPSGLIRAPISLFQCTTADAAVLVGIV
jgi:hypothetical protein